jgi:hypothetical protein
VLGLAGGCGPAAPAPVGPPAPAAAPAAPARSLRATAAAPAAAPAPTAAACTIVRGLSARCGACVAVQCCVPPVAFDRALGLNLGCHMGCRKPSAARDQLPPDQYVEVLAHCLSTCDAMFPDPTRQAAPLDACMTELCLAECLRN